MTDRAALVARFTWNDGSTLARVARREHRCSGRSYGDAEPWRCEQPIRVGELHVEYLGETAAYQSGKRYHIACAVRAGVVRPDEEAAVDAALVRYALRGGTP